MKYNKELLDNFCKENELVLENIYEHTNRETIINGKCKTINCHNRFSKNFRMLLRSKNFCYDCSVINGKIKSTETNITKYGVENVLQNEEIKNKMKKTNLKKYGVENPFQNEEIKNKIKQTNLKKYGFECALQNQEIKDKVKQTNLKKYDVDNPMKKEEFKNKLKETNLNKYGFECALQNQEIKDKVKQTYLKKYGCEYSFQSEVVKEKIKETNLKKYGVENVSNNKEIRNKAEETMLKKYGFRYASQNPCISEKQFSNSNKIYTFSSGETINIQGYENFALDILIKKYNDNEILNRRIDMPKIFYEFNKKNRVYFPDLYIPKDNLIIEVKSDYTYKNNLIKNILKAHAVRKLKYNYEVWIFDIKKRLTII